MGRNNLKKRYTKNLNIQIQEEDFKKLQQGLANSTCWTMTEYCRKLLTGKPVTVFYRNQSLDEFIQEAITLRKHLQEIGQKNEHLTPLINDIKNCINKIYDHVCQNKT